MNKKINTVLIFYLKLYVFPPGKKSNNCMFAEILVQCEIYDNYVLEYLVQCLVHCDI